MENYIDKINRKLLAEKDYNKAKRVKLKYQIAGGIVLGLGIAGFLASFITFMVLFLKFKTDDAFTAWIVAIPFLLLIVAGSVLARIGDAVLPQERKHYHFKKYKSEVVKKNKKNDDKPQEEVTEAEENKIEDLT